jgi:hypothetical protein
MNDTTELAPRVRFVSSNSPSLDAGVEIVSRHGLDRPRALLLALAVQGAVLGSRHRLLEPDSSYVLPTLNLLVESAVGGALGTLLRPAEDRIGRILRKYQDEDTKSLILQRRRSKELLTDIERRFREKESQGNMNFECLSLQEGGDLGPNIEKNKAVSLQQVYRETGIKLIELGLASRPLLLTPGLDLKLLRKWSDLAFDRFVSYVRAQGGGFNELSNLCPADLREVLRLLQAASAGEDLVLFDGRPVAGAGLCLLLPVSAEELVSIHRHPVLGQPESLSHFVIVDSDGEIEASEDEEAEAKWRMHLAATVLSLRLGGEQTDHFLHPEAVHAYREYREQAGGAAADTACGVAHLRQLPRLALALTLGFHVAGDHRLNREIGLETFVRGRGLATRISTMHLRNLRLLQDRVHHLDLESMIRTVVRKIEAKGALRKRELQRSFNAQRWELYEPAVEAAVERQLLQWSDDRLGLFFDPEVSVSVCQ